MSTKLDPSKTRTRPLGIAMLENGLKLLPDAMKEVGPAAQTLGGIIRLTAKETFAAADRISLESRLPVKAVRRHLATLHDAGWISNEGRQKTRAGHARRTCTLKLTAKTTESLRNYCHLPWWTVATPINAKWCSRAVWSVICQRWFKLRAVAIRQGANEYNMTELLGHLENLGGDERFAFSLRELTDATGLTRPSVIEAKHTLNQSKLIRWSIGSGGSDADILAPNWDTEVIEETVEPGRCRIHLRG